MDAVTCPTCNGEKVVPDVDLSGDTFLLTECLDCGGEGWVEEEHEV